jgi:hypothetical protein
MAGVVGCPRGGAEALPGKVWSCPRSVESSQNANFRTGFGKNGLAKSRTDAGFCCAESLLKG